jgi:hypothetical protein
MLLFFIDLVRSACFSSNFTNFFQNYSRTSSRTVRFGSVQKCESLSSVRFADFQKGTPLPRTPIEFFKQFLNKNIVLYYTFLYNTFKVFCIQFVMSFF